MKRFAFLFLISAVLVLFARCGGEPPDRPPEKSNARETTAPEPSPERIRELKTESLLNSMTLEEKVGRLFLVRAPEENAAEDALKYSLGGYILFSRNIEGKNADELRRDIKACQDAAKIPLLIAVDEEGGEAARVSANPLLRSSPFASPRELYSAGGLDAIIKDAAEKNKLLLSLGFNVNLAPVADVCGNPGAFIYNRAFGGDARAVSDYVSAVVSQSNKDGIGCVLKHFPGYGDSEDTHAAPAADARPLEAFRASDFLPFRAGIKAGGKSVAVMVSHVIFSAVDPNLPASLSPAVHALARSELDFDGVVVTDALDMGAAAEYDGDGAAAVLALLAGNDLIITTDYRSQIPRVIKAVEGGEIPISLVDGACRRVLLWEYDLGLL